MAVVERNRKEEIALGMTLLGVVFSSMYVASSSSSAPVFLMVALQSLWYFTVTNVHILQAVSERLLESQADGVWRIAF